jgi:hypothetical protein
MFNTLMKKKRSNWLEREKSKDPNFTQVDTQLLVQRLPAGLIPRVRKFCKTNDIKIRRFVEDALRLALKERLGAKQ